MEHITIEDLRREIGLKRGEPLTDEQFGVLLAGFREHAARRGLFSTQSVYNAIHRGWMSAQMAHFFKTYALE